MFINKKTQPKSTSTARPSQFSCRESSTEQLAMTVPVLRPTIARKVNRTDHESCTLKAQRQRKYTTLHVDEITVIVAMPD